MKKITLLVIAALLSGTSSAWTKKAPAPAKDVLAVCSDETGRVQLFEVIGDLKTFTGPRMTVQHAEVSIRHIATKTAFDGVVTLTKTTPYQFVLNGYSTFRKEAKEAANVLLYGTSAGAQLNILKNTDNVEFKNYSCVLNAKLLLQP